MAAWTLPQKIADWISFLSAGLDRRSRKYLPAILLGMDVLGTVDALMIDYQRGELRFLPAGSDESDTIEFRRPPFGRLP